MAMNETYNLSITGDGSGLNKELDSILSKLKSMGNSDLSKPLKDFESKMQRATQLNQELQKVMKKNEGNTIVSSKDMTNTLKMTQELTGHMKDLQGVLGNIQKTGLSNGIKADYDALHQTVNGLSGAINSASTKQKQFNSLKTTTDPNVKALIKDWERLGKMPDEYNKAKNRISETKGKNKELTQQRNRVKSANQRAGRDGKYTAKDGAEVAQALNQDHGKYQSELNKNQKSLKKMRKEQDNGAKQLSKLDDKFTSGDMNQKEYTKEKAKIESLNNARDEAIKELEKYVQNLQGATKEFGQGGATRNQFESSRVERSRDTFLGQVRERAPSIASHGTMATMGAIGIQYAQGKGASEAQRPYEIAMGQQTGASDYSALRKNLFKASDEQGLGFKPTELVEMSSQAMQAMGDKGLPNQEEVTTQLATGARGMGIADTDSYLSSMTDIMHSGGIDNEIDMKQFQKTVSGGIKESGMKAQADEQLKALSSMTNTMGAQRELTTGDLNSIAGMQGIFAESGSKSLQGEKGATALNQIQQGISQAYQDPGQRNIMGFGSEYTGITGAYEQRGDLEDPSKMGANLEKMMSFYGTDTESGKSATGMAMMDNYGISKQQADEIMEMRNKGELSEESLQKKLKEYEGSSEVDKNVKDQSEQQQGQENKNQSRQEAQSQALYDSVGALRNFQGMLAGMNPIAYQAMIAIEALGASAMSSAAMMGGSYGLKKGTGVLNRKGSKMTKPVAGAKGSNKKGGSKGGTTTTKNSSKESPSSGGKSGGKSGFMAGGMGMPMMMGMGMPMFGGGVADSGDTGTTGKTSRGSKTNNKPNNKTGKTSGENSKEGKKRGGMFKGGANAGRMMGYGMMLPAMMGGMSGGEDGEGGGISSTLSMMAPYMAMDFLMSGGVGKMGSLGKKGIGKGKDLFNTGKKDYKKGGMSRVGKRGKHKFLRGDKKMRGLTDNIKGKAGNIAKSPVVSKTESVLGKGFDKTKNGAKGLAGKIGKTGGQSPNQGKGIASKLGSGKGVMGGLGKAGQFIGKRFLPISAGMTGISMIPDMMKGDTEGASSKFGGAFSNIIDPLGLGYGDNMLGKPIEETTKKAMDTKKMFGKDGMVDLGWRNGDKDGKGGFQDSVVGKGVGKAWGGIKSLFGGGDDKTKAGGGGGGGSVETGMGGAHQAQQQLEGSEDIKGSENKKKKMTAEELRRKNNKSESENLNVFKSLLDRWEQTIMDAKGLDSGGSSDGGSDSGGSASDVGGSGKKKIYSFLKQKGLSDNQVSAVMGNLEQESKLDPNSVNESSGAFGIAQWMGARKTGLDNYAKSEGKKNTDLDVQLDYLWKEMESGYDSDMLHQAGWSKDASLEKNTKAFATGFERMGTNEAMMDTRVNNAKSFKKQFAGGGGGSDWSNQDSSYSNRSLATMQAQSTNTPQSSGGNTANVSVTINVNGEGNDADTARTIADKMDSYFNSDDLSIFQNNFRRT